MTRDLPQMHAHCIVRVGRRHVVLRTLFDLRAEFLWDPAEVATRTVRGSAASPYAGTQARSRIVLVGFSVLKTALTGMPIVGVPSFR